MEGADQTLGETAAGLSFLGGAIGFFLILAALLLVIVIALWVYSRKTDTRTSIRRFKFLFILLFVACQRSGETPSKPRDQVVPAAPRATESSPEKSEQSATVPIDKKQQEQHSESDDQQQNDQREFRTQLIQKIWQSGLGQLLADYLFIDNFEQAQLKENDLIERVFSEPKWMLARITAIQLLTKDLYLQNRLTEHMLARVMILVNDIYEKQMNHSRFPAKNIGYQAGIAFLLTLPFGSPLVRKEAGKVAQRASNLLPKKLQFKKVEGDIAPLELNKLATKEVLKGYSFKKFGQIYFSIFGPYTIMFWFVNDWSQAVNQDLVDATDVFRELSKIMEKVEL